METIGHKLDTPQRLYAFGELMLLPGYATMSPKDIDIGITLNGLELGVPFLSAPMDTVTESELAIALALRGGLGVIHRNCSVENAVEMVNKVKKAHIPDETATAAKDRKGRLAVGAAISPLDSERAIALADTADLLFTDVASFHNAKLIEGTKRVAKAVGKRIVIGNLGTKEGVLRSIKEIGKENIAAVKVGMGGGSICITTEVSGVGSPVTYGVEQAALALKELGLLDEIPIIADGGIRYARDIAFSLSLGASMVMLGNLFARCEESPGDIVTKDGKQYKVYWGMGSAEARKKRMILDRYQDFGRGKQVDEGIKMQVPLEGRVDDVVERLAAELRVTMGYVGARSIKEMKDMAQVVVKTAAQDKAGI